MKDAQSMLLSLGSSLLTLQRPACEKKRRDSCKPREVFCCSTIMLVSEKTEGLVSPGKTVKSHLFIGVRICTTVAVADSEHERISSGQLRDPFQASCQRLTSMWVRYHVDGLRISLPPEFKTTETKTPHSLPEVANAIDRTEPQE